MKNNIDPIIAYERFSELYGELDAATVVIATSKTKEVDESCEAILRRVSEFPDFRSHFQDIVDKSKASEDSSSTSETEINLLEGWLHVTSLVNDFDKAKRIKHTQEILSEKFERKRPARKFINTSVGAFAVSIFFSGNALISQHQLQPNASLSELTSNPSQSIIGVLSFLGGAAIGSKYHALSYKYSARRQAKRELANKGISI